MEFQNINSSAMLFAFMEKVKIRLQEEDPVAQYLNKKYLEIEEKLPEDMKQLASQYLLLFGMIIEQTDSNEELANQILLPWKSWDRLYRYMDSKARPTSDKDKNFRPRCAMVDSFTILEWVIEYYALDDKEDFEKEEAEKAEREKKRLAAEAKIKEMKDKAAAKKNKAVKQEVINEDSPEDEEEDDVEEVTENVTPAPAPITKKKSPRDVDGQIDFFSLLMD